MGAESDLQEHGERTLSRSVVGSELVRSNRVAVCGEAPRKRDV